MIKKILSLSFIALSIVASEKPSTKQRKSNGVINYPNSQTKQTNKHQDQKTTFKLFEKNSGTRTRMDRPWAKNRFEIPGRAASSFSWRKPEPEAKSK